MLTGHKDNISGLVCKKNMTEHLPQTDSETMVVRAETLERSAVQSLPMVRMCNAYQEFGSFLHRSPIEVNGTIFGHHIMYMSSGRDNASTVDYRRSNLAFSLIGT